MSVKGTSIRKSHSIWESFKGAPRPRPQAMEVMAFTVSLNLRPGAATFSGKSEPEFVLSLRVSTQNERADEE